MNRVQPDKAAEKPLCHYNLEDYFSFLSGVEPADGAVKKPPELYLRKFTF
jgi:hypothetical protein